jgi:hypothetical protein
VQQLRSFLHEKVDESGPTGFFDMDVYDALEAMYDTPQKKAEFKQKIDALQGRLVSEFNEKPAQNHIQVECEIAWLQTPHLH